MPRVALAMHGSAMLYEAAIAYEIFGVDRSDLSPGGEWYDLVVCTADGAAHPWLPNLPTASYAEIARADSVVVPSTDDLEGNPDPELVESLRVAHERGVRIASLCTGAFVLAAAGLLDNRVATTHWMHADDLARRYPQVDVRADVLYIDEGDVLTSAGKTAAQAARLAAPAAHRPRPRAPRTHRRLRRPDRRQLRHGHRRHPAPSLSPCIRCHADCVPRDVPARLTQPAHVVAEVVGRDRRDLRVVRVTHQPARSSRTHGSRMVLAKEDQQVGLALDPRVAPGPTITPRDQPAPHPPRRSTPP